MRRECNFILAMNPIATVASLLLLTSTFLYVNGAPVEMKMENMLHTSRILLDDDSETFMQKEVNIPRQSKLSSEQSEATTITTLHTIVNHNLQSNINTLSAIEAKDMEESFVHPRDDDDDSITPDKPQNASATVVPSINSLTATALHEAMEEDEKHATEPANLFPENPDKSITDLPLDMQKKFTHETYRVGVDKSNATRVTVSDVNIVPVKNTMMESFNISNVQESYRTLETETREEIMKKHLDMIALESKNETEKLPPGVIGLISAVGFATVAVAAYIGLLGWKRYQEYSHGHRELLVNDFDSNDINNFEL